MNAPERLAATDAPRISIAINNLRGIVVLLVVAVHSVLAYLWTLPPEPYAFDKPPFAWRTFAIVDPHHFIGFDILCAWANVFLMPLFFLISGLFVWQSLERNGPIDFVYRRWLRLGLPFLFGVLVLMPLAVFPTYLQTAAHPGIADFWHHWFALPFWPAGPMWFLWVLLIGDVAAAMCFGLFSGLRERVFRLSGYAQRRPVQSFGGILLVSALAYIPMGVAFDPMAWFHKGPFSFQLSFPGLYAAYFCAGIVVGARALDGSSIAGSLARHWKSWTAASAVSFPIWLLVSAKAFVNPATASPEWNLASAVALVPACLASSCCVLALTLRFARSRTPAMDSLQRNSYAIYLTHCVFVIWAQFALLELAWPAVVKAPIVFVMTLMLSWMSAVALRRLPLLETIIGVGPRVRASILPPLRSRPVLPVPD
ncbi:MAG TPA: acyltransferase [Rhizomicrobium sp.]